MSAVLDIRTYALKAGAHEAFEKLFTEEALPMLGRYGIEVAYYGFSDVDPDRFLLIRRFANLEEREERLNAFYGSAEFLDEYDERVMGMIETYHVVVVCEPRLGGAAAQQRLALYRWFKAGLGAHLLPTDGVHPDAV